MFGGCPSFWQMAYLGSFPCPQNGRLTPAPSVDSARLTDSWTWTSCSLVCCFTSGLLMRRLSHPGLWTGCSLLSSHRLVVTPLDQDCFSKALPVGIGLWGSGQGASCLLPAQGFLLFWSWWQVCSGSLFLAKNESAAFRRGPWIGQAGGV